MPHARPMKCHLIVYFVDDIEIAGGLVIFLLYVRLYLQRETW